MFDLDFKNFFEDFSEDFSILNEEIASYDEIDDKEALYQTYYQSYAERGLKPWSQSDFEWRATKWIFAGVLPREGVSPERVGMVTARKKNNVIKLTGMQGPNTKAKVRGLLELAKTGLPIWGAMDKDFTVRLQKLGFSTPPPTAMKLILPVLKSDPQFSSGGNWGELNPDGSINFELSGVGQTTKYFVANDEFYQMMISKVLSSKKIDPKTLSLIQKWPMLPSFAKKMASPVLKTHGLDVESMDWLSNIMKNNPTSTAGPVQTAEPSYNQVP